MRMEQSFVISKVVSNKFNNYFFNVPQNILRELGEPNNKFQDYLKDPDSHTFFS